jgi:hypothetical protein
MCPTYEFEWPYSRTITTTNAGKNAVKQEHLYTVGRNAMSTTIMENRMETIQKTKDRTAIRSNDTAPGHLPVRIQ